MPVSEDFTTLRRQVGEADQSIKEAASQDKAAVEAKVEEARERTEARAAEMRARRKDASDETIAHWEKIQGDWDQHTQRLRERIDAQKATVKADMAESDAEWAEADAAYAILTQPSRECTGNLFIDDEVLERFAGITDLGRYHASGEGGGELMPDFFVDPARLHG